jgi:predicted DNA-binding ribbon-helix-helix protein
MSSLVKKNVTVNGQRTSVRLEPQMWEALQEVCMRQNCTIHDLCSELDACRGKTSLTSALRTLLIVYFRYLSTQIGNPEFISSHTQGIGWSVAQLLA